MRFLPRTSGTRPRLACELRSAGVVAARVEEASGVLTAVSRITYDQVELPKVRVGESSGAPDGRSSRATVVSGMRKALEAVGQRGRDITLIVPDSAVRVLLLDFDSLPGKASEALPIVRFRLKKMVPFDAEHSAVSYQVLRSQADTIQVLAVAMPGELLAEYESMVREAGFEPGSVLPATLAALAGLPESGRPALLVNACDDTVTTAIVRSGVLLLHRTVDLLANLEQGTSSTSQLDAHPGPPASRAEIEDTSISAIAARLTAAGRSSAVKEVSVATAPAQNAQNEIAQAVSVALAYFEDTLESPPSLILAAGTLGAPELTSIIDRAQVRAVAVQEIVDRNMLGIGASTGGNVIPLGWLAGVRGALTA